MANAVLYGFYNLKDVASRRVNEVGLTPVGDAVERTLAEHNRQMDALLNLFVTPLTDYSRRYRQVGARRLQPLDENGRARPTKSGAYYDVAFPIQMAGDAFGANWVARAKLSVQDVNDELAAMLIADKRWVRDHILSALYDNTTWPFTDEQYGSLTIQPLANGDAVTYLVRAGQDAGATDTHYLAQAAGIADATNPYPAIYTELLEHPENDGEVIAFIPTALKATTQALTSFIEAADPDIQLGANSDRLVGSLGAAVPGTVIGKADGVWIVEWPSLPAADMIVAVTTGGARPLGMRQDPEPELQGFKRQGVIENHPWYEDQYARRAGFGALNRVGAVVYRVGNGAYAIPTGYTNPIP